MLKFKFNIFQKIVKIDENNDDNLLSQTSDLMERKFKALKDNLLHELVIIGILGTILKVVGSILAHKLSFFMQNFRVSLRRNNSSNNGSSYRSNNKSLFELGRHRPRCFTHYLRNKLDFWLRPYQAALALVKSSSTHGDCCLFYKSANHLIQNLTFFYSPCSSRPVEHSVRRYDESCTSDVSLQAWRGYI